jgi:hypothetical protein
MAIASRHGHLRKRDVGIGCNGLFERKVSFGPWSHLGAAVPPASARSRRSSPIGRAVQHFRGTASRGPAIGNLVVACP